MQKAPTPGAFTAREIEVLAHINSGKSNEEIARALFLSVRTIRQYIVSVVSKLQPRCVA